MKPLRLKFARPTTAWWANSVPALGLFGFAVLLFWNTLDHQFVFDDFTLIVQNPAVTEQQWSRLLSFHSYRPLRTLTYALNHAAGGLDPWGYHLVNVLLHALAAVLVYGLFDRLLQRRLAAWLGAALFACHPVQTAAVAYVSGRKDLLAAAFSLVAIHFYLNWRRRGGWGNLAALFFFFALALLSKEEAIVLPALLLLVGLLDGRERGRSLVDLARRLGRELRLFAGLLSVSALALLGAVYFSRASRMDSLWGGSPAAHIGTSFKLFVHYLQLAFFPYPLVADYSGDVFPVATGPADWTAWLAFAATLGLLGLALGLLARMPPVGVGMLWFFVGLVPVLQLVPIHELAADHFLYLPSIGLVLVAGGALDLMLRQRGLKMVGGGCVVLLILGMSLATVRRNRDWATPERLWKATLEMAPNSYRANLNLGDLLFRQGERQRGIELTLRSAELAPRESAPHANLGGMFRLLGFDLLRKQQLDEAERALNRALEHLRKSISMRSDDPFAHSNLGDVYQDRANLAEARGAPPPRALDLRSTAYREYRKALEMGFPFPHFSSLVEFKLGSLFADQRLYPDALSYLESAAQSLPDRFEVQNLTGFCFLQLERWEQAARYFERALLLEVRKDVLANLARCYGGLARQEGAVQLLQTRLDRFGNDARGHFAVARLYRELGDVDNAHKHLRRALELKPAPPLRGEILKELGQSEPRTHS